MQVTGRGGVVYAGVTMGDDAVTILADAAVAHRHLTGLGFVGQCRGVWHAHTTMRGGSDKRQWVMMVCAPVATTQGAT